MAIRMQQRTGTYDQWNTSNPILNGAEIGYESDTNKFKIGDGSTHWNDLPYFLNEDTITTSLDGYIPESLLGVANGVAQLNSSGKLVSDQIPNVDEITQDAINTALVAGTGLDKTYDDNANTITLDIDSTVATKTYADDAAGAAQAAAELTASGELSTHASDSTSVHGITDTAELATKAFAASLLTGATKTNISITGDKDGLTISAENGVADSTTSDLAEGTNLYFTDERAQDAVGGILGTGFVYNDSTNSIGVNQGQMTSLVVDGASGNSYGLVGTSEYLDVKDTNGYNKEIELDIAAVEAKLVTDGFAKTTDIAELAQDAVGNAVGTGLTYTDSTGEIKVTPNTYDAYGSAAAITPSTLGLGNVDNTSDANKPVSTATQTALDTKVSKSGSTMTGALTLSGAPTSDLHAATKLYVDNVTAGINFHQAAHVATTANLSADYNNGTNGVGATLTSTANGTWTTLDGHTSFTQYDRILVKDQTDAKQNGIYILSDLGSGSSKWILTRATDADNNPAGEIKNGDFILVLNGTVNASYGFVNNSPTNPIAIGTDNITYVPFNAAKTIAAGNGLQEATPGVLSIDTSITQTRVSGVSDTEIGYLDGVTSAIQTQLNTKAPLESPTFTGTVSGITKTMVGLGNVDNTSDASKPVSTATQTALDLKAPLESPTFTGTVTLPTGTVTSGMILDGTIVNADINASAAIAQSKISGLTSDLAAKAPLASPTFTGTVTIPSGAALGTPASATLTNATGLPVSTGISGLGTGVATALAVNTGSAGAVALFNGALGTPSSVTLTNATGLPLTTGVTGTLPVANGGTGITAFGTGVATFLGTPSSANLISAVTDETGTGSLVFGTSPTITPAAATLSTATSGAGYMGLPQNSTTTGAYTVAAADAGKHIYSTATRTITIDSNANLALPIGTAITFISGAGATTTIAITTDTLLLAGAGNTGSRTLAAHGMATAVKVASTTWYISGNGLS